MPVASPSPLAVSLVKRELGMALATDLSTTLAAMVDGRQLDLAIVAQDKRRATDDGRACRRL